MNNSREDLDVLELDAESLLALLAALKGPNKERMSVFALRSIDAGMAVCSGVSYVVKLEVTTCYRKKAPSDMESMVRAKHAEAINTNGIPALASAVEGLLKQKDMSSLERFYDLAEKLRMDAAK